MQSEHLTNLHFGWVATGWLVAASSTAAIYLGGAGLGLVGPDSGAALWVSISMGGGFFLGGFFVGRRWSNAPILHGAAITVFGVMVWFLVALLGGSGNFEPVSLALGLILLQLLASCAGGWMGRRVTLGRSGPE